MVAHLNYTDTQEKADEAKHVSVTKLDGWPYSEYVKIDPV